MKEEKTIFDAINQNDVKLVAEMIPDWYLEIEYEDGYTPLFYAVLNGNLEIVKLLVEAGANPNALDIYMGDPLMNASYIGKLDIVQYLVEQGANPKYKSPDKNTALMVAASKDGPEQLEVVKFLIQSGADLHAKNFMGDTLLIWACNTYNPSLEIIKYLVEDQQLDINEKNNWGQTALMFATRYDQLEVVKYLVEHGASTEIKREDGRTVFDFAKEGTQTASYLKALL